VWKRAESEDLNDPPQALDGMAFSEALQPNGTPAHHLTIDYGADLVQWDYDPATERYSRSVDGQPHLDANTGDQVTAANVVVIYTHHQPDLSIVESEWQGNKSFSTELQIWTLGPAMVLRDGQMVKGYWMRWHEADRLSFWFDEGMTEMITLKPGNTWFQVVPLDFTDLRIEGD
jgi:hypothetical protein